MVPAASPGGPQKTSPAMSDTHVPVLPRTADLSLSGRVGGQFCKSHADYKGIALQQENSRRKPKKAKETLRGEDPGEEDQDTAWTGREATWGGHAGSRREGSAVSMLTKPAASPAGGRRPPCHPSGQEDPVRS